MGVPNRYRIEMTPEEIVEEDAEYERVMALSDEELDIEFEESMREYAEELDSMLPDELYRHRRRTKLGLCIGARALIPRLEFIGRDILRTTQWGLWKLRYHRRTGIWPGSDN